MQTVAAAVRSVQELMEELKILPTTPLDNRILGSLAVPSPSGVPILQTTEVLIVALIQIFVLCCLEEISRGYD